MCICIDLGKPMFLSNSGLFLCINTINFGFAFFRHNFQNEGICARELIRSYTVNVLLKSSELGGI